MSPAPGRDGDGRLSRCGRAACRVHPMDRQSVSYATQKEISDRGANGMTFGWGFNCMSLRIVTFDAPEVLGDQQR